MTKHRNPAYSEEYRGEAVRRSGLPNQTTASVVKVKHQRTTDL
jgi:hypothetical protein